MASPSAKDVEHFEADDDDIFMPDDLRPALPVVSGKPVASPPPSAGRGRRLSSLGSLHHAGHSSWLTAAGHLVTAIIGAGVLGLPNAVAWLGWIAGPICLTVFFVTTLWTATMLCDCYHVKGKRHTRYKWAVLHIMGPRHAVLLALCQNLNMILTTVGYHIAAADSMRYIARLSCQLQGLPSSSCVLVSQWQHTLVFGAVQMLMSMLPNLESVWWSSIVGALMSLGYSGIAIGLGASQAGNGQGTLLGRPAPPVEKAFGVCNALGCIGFAYSCAIVLVEVQDTLREPPRAAVSMRKSIRVGLSTTFTCYALVSVLGYLALGNSVPDNVLVGFHKSPAWVNILANAMVLVHMVSAYQVYAQPVFQTIEDALLLAAPTLKFAPPRKEFAVRLVYRTAYVAVGTLLACLLPFFSAFTGLVGAVTFAPTAVIYPILMYMRVASPGPHQRCLMWVVLSVMSAVAVVATAGSIESIIATAGSFKLFSTPEAA
ncbi:amino acid permease [Raphidocelis subcapitata]|uniref:Amino acid permease n=1 Tax=Raphidocelis subcapitata TaxID=307507 RepID=A0A2V0PN58_9CHLO|nr:amino acid permease [Raphidocelis subcapitata]|eukprot:GBG00553.1 amino acid permease [Raphidocelis subcapitata]